MRINTVKLSNLRNDEHFQFGTEFRTLVLATGAAALKIATQFSQWQSLYEQEDAVLKKIVKSALTEKIWAADSERDTLFRGMAAANKAALKHYDANVREAAKCLQIVFETYGDVAKKPLNEETSALYNLIVDLKSTKYAADVTTVGLDTWLLHLEESNNALSTLVQSRAHETAVLPDAALREVRAQIDEQYNILVDIINVYAITTPLPAYNTFIRDWNVFVKKYEDTIKNRYGKYAATKAHKSNAEAQAQAQAALDAAETALANAQATAAAAAAAAAAAPENPAAQAALEAALEALADAEDNVNMTKAEIVSTIASKEKPEKK